MLKNGRVKWNRGCETKNKNLSENRHNSRSSLTDVGFRIGSKAEQWVAYGAAESGLLAMGAHLRAFSTRDVWTVRCPILVEPLGAEREKIVPDAHLVRDLGYD